MSDRDFLRTDYLNTLLYQLVSDCLGRTMIVSPKIRETLIEHIGELKEERNKLPDEDRLIYDDELMKWL